MPVPEDRGANEHADLTGSGAAASISTAFDSEEACWQFLDRKTPDELVEIFRGTDPLRIVERCGRYLWNEGLFMEVDRLVEHASCHIAFRCALRPREATLDNWLDSCIAHSARTLCRKDVEMVKEAADRDVPPWAPAHAFIQGAFDYEEVTALRVCSAFNCMPRRERCAFFALCMDKRSVDECLEAGFGPPEWLREACIKGLDLILGFAPHPALDSCDDAREQSDES